MSHRSSCGEILRRRWSAFGAYDALNSWISNTCFVDHADLEVFCRALRWAKCLVKAGIGEIHSFKLGLDCRLKTSVGFDALCE